MDRVHTFAVDKVMRAEVKEYIVDYLKAQIINRAFQNQDIVGYAEAKLIIENCFANMDKEFGGEVIKPHINENE